MQRFRTAMILWDKSEEDFALASPVTAYVTGSALTSEAPSRPSSPPPAAS